MAVRICISQEEVSAYLLGDIDHHTAKEMREEIDAAVQRALPKCLLMDFKDVSFMDSSGIGLVLGRYRLMQTFSGTVRVTGVSAQLYKVMRLAGLDKLVSLENGGTTK